MKSEPQIESDDIEVLSEKRIKKMKKMAEMVSLGMAMAIIPRFIVCFFVLVCLVR